MKPRILFISRKWPPAVGGMETYSMELSKTLDEIAEVRTLVLQGRPDGTPPSMLSYGIFLLRAMFHCAIKAGAYDRVVFGDLVLFPAAVVHRIMRPQAIRVVIVYGLDLVYHRRSGWFPVLYRAFFFLFRTCQSTFCSIVAISKHTAGLATAEQLRNVTVINPCLPENGLFVYEAEPAVPLAWTQASDRLRILYFGRLIPRKGSLWFAKEVMPLLPEQAEFFVVGDTQDKQYKKQLAESLRTHCLGRLDSASLSEMIRAADAVVMPNIPTDTATDVEGFGLVAVETTALGGQLLASRMDGIIDAVVDGVTGTLVAPADAPAWASAVAALQIGHSEDRHRKSQAIAAATKALFSREAQARAFSSLLCFEDSATASMDGR